MALDERVERAIAYMVQIANDNRYGYSQDDRWGDREGHWSFDCSALVITAFERAGFPVKQNGATTTANMGKAFIKTGFTNVRSLVTNIRTGEGLQRGDILLRPANTVKGITWGHTAVYLGNGQMVDAVSNYDGRQGDSSGREILVHNYGYNGDWTYVLRWIDGSGGGDDYTYKDCIVLKLPQKIKKGNKFAVIGRIQMILKGLGFYRGNIDSDFGSQTESAVKEFQKKEKIASDGIIGAVTYAHLLKVEDLNS